MKKQKEEYNNLAMALGLHYDENNNVVYGVKDGFTLLIWAEDSRYPYMLTIQVTAKNDDGTKMSEDEKKELVMKINEITGMKQEEDHTLTFQQNNADNIDHLKTITADSVNRLIMELHTKGYSSCCCLCGKNKRTAVFKTDSCYMHICQECEIKFLGIDHLIAQERVLQKENIVGGIIGAVVGSLLGMLCIVLLGSLGIIAAFAGTVMAVSVMKGYEFLGRKHSKRSIIICVLVMIIMTYVGDRMSWAVILAWESGENLFYCYQIIPSLLSLELIEKGSYIFNLILLYACLMLGALPTVASVVKEQQFHRTTVRIGNFYVDN